MDDSKPSPPRDHIATLVEQDRRADATELLEQRARASLDQRKETMQTLRRAVDESPGDFGWLCSALVPFLEDEERPVRLTTAKLLVALADGEPSAAVEVVPALAERLADDDEFYYVRARAAEALGYVALEYPDAVASPEVMADLRVGLSFDEPEVKRKLAKALEHVALGDPGRLRHQTGQLAGFLDDGDELVRYHLLTALVAVGCEHPGALAEAADALQTRLTDEYSHVRGRALEAIGVLVRAGVSTDVSETALVNADDVADTDEQFLERRAQFARGAVDVAAAEDQPIENVGTLAGVRSTTEEAVAAITAPDGDHDCPNCGLSLPEGGPPTCPRCGVPRG